jgi:hypothetical protein
VCRQSNKCGQGLVFAAIGADAQRRLRFHAPASPDPAVCEQHLHGATVEACVAERIGSYAKRTRESLDGQEPHGAPMTLDADDRLARNACSRGKLRLTQACGKPVRTQSWQLGRRLSERQSRRFPTAFQPLASGFNQIGGVAARSEFLVQRAREPGGPLPCPAEHARHLMRVEVAFLSQ